MQEYCEEKEDKDVERIVMARRKRADIHKCGSQLPGRASDVFLLLMQGASQSDIAERLGISKPWVSQLIDIIHAQLKRKLQDMGWECNETIGVPLNL